MRKIILSTAVLAEEDSGYSSRYLVNKQKIVKNKLGYHQFEREQIEIAGLNSFSRWQADGLIFLFGDRFLLVRRRACTVLEEFAERKRRRKVSAKFNILIYLISNWAMNRWAFKSESQKTTQWAVLTFSSSKERSFLAGNRSSVPTVKSISEMKAWTSSESLVLFSTSSLWKYLERNQLT